MPLSCSGTCKSEAPSPRSEVVNDAFGTLSDAVGKSAELAFVQVTGSGVGASRGRSSFKDSVLRKGPFGPSDGLKGPLSAPLDPLRVVPKDLELVHVEDVVGPA